jgi:hypothetical protein
MKRYDLEVDALALSARPTANWNGVRVYVHAEEPFVLGMIESLLNQGLPVEAVLELMQPEAIRYYLNDTEDAL